MTLKTGIFLIVLAIAFGGIIYNSQQAAGFFAHRQMDESLR